MDAGELDFQEIYEEYQAKIRGYLRRLIGEAEAEDLSQEVFLKVSKALNSFRGESKLSTWIYRIATNAALDRLRSPAFQREVGDGFSEEELEHGAAGFEGRNIWTGEKALLIEQQRVRDEMNECIRDFIGRLPESYRAVLVLSELEGFRNQEIAEILGISLGTVKIRLHRARQKLKEELWAHCEPYWIEGNEFVPDFRGAIEEFRKKN